MLAFAFSTQGEQEASDAQEARADRSSQLQAFPVIVEGTVFINKVIGFQGRQACQRKEKAQGHSLHVTAAGQG